MIYGPSRATQAYTPQGLDHAVALGEGNYGSIIISFGIIQPPWGSVATFVSEWTGFMRTDFELRTSGLTSAMVFVFLRFFRAENRIHPPIKSEGILFLKMH